MLSAMDVAGKVARGPFFFPGFFSGQYPTSSAPVPRPRAAQAVFDFPTPADRRDRRIGAGQKINRTQYSVAEFGRIPAGISSSAAPGQPKTEAIRKVSSAQARPSRAPAPAVSPGVFAVSAGRE
jgi:hypothetical protein